MLKNLTQFYRPSTIEEACSLISAREKRNVLLAGGTHWSAVDDSSVEGFVDLSGLNLSYIHRTESGYSIGAMTPVQDIFKSSVLTGPAGTLIKTAAGKIGSTLLRNSITIGGDLFSSFPWCDLPPALLAVDASAVIKKGIPKRTVSVKNLLESHPRNFLEPSEIIVEIQIPDFGPNTGTAFRKMAKTHNDYSQITVAALLTVECEKVVNVRIGLNAVTKHPVRCYEGEKTILGNPPTKEIFSLGAKKALEGLEFCSDFRVSKEYKQEVLPVLISRCLEEAYLKTRS